MSIYTSNIMKAVIAALKSDSQVSALIGDRVFTHVQQNCAFPYVAIRSFSAPYDTKTEDGTETTLRIHVYSEYEGAAQVLDVLSKVHTALHKQQLTVEGANLVNLRYDGGGDAEPEPDGKRWQGFVDFRSVCTN